MKSIMKILSLLLMTLIGSNVIHAQGIWKQKADAPGRTSTTAFSIGNKGYIVTGYDTIGTLNDFWEYDPSANSWTKKNNFPGPVRYAAIGFSIGNKGYLGIGIGPGTTLHNDFWEYNSDSDKWTQKTSYPGSGRSYAVGFNIGNKGYVGTGSNLSSNNNDFWEYDPDSNTWKGKAYFPGTPRMSAIGFGIGNKGYVGTGANGTLRYNDFWEYNPDSNKWTQKANVPNNKRSGAIRFVIGNTGYVGAGFGNLNDLWAYNIATDTWTSRTGFSGQYRSGSVSFSIGTKAYMGTGVDTNYSNFLNDIWEYDPNATGIAETDKHTTFNIYPNPNAGSFRIESSDPMNGYEIYDLRGKQICKNIFENNIMSVEINVPLAEGMYFVKVLSDENVSLQKFMVNK